MTLGREDRCGLWDSAAILPMCRISPELTRTGRNAEALLPRLLQRGCCLLTPPVCLWTGDHMSIRDSQLLQLRSWVLKQFKVCVCRDTVVCEPTPTEQGLVLFSWSS